MQILSQVERTATTYTTTHTTPMENWIKAVALAAKLENEGWTTKIHPGPLLEIKKTKTKTIPANA